MKKKLVSSIIICTLLLCLTSVVYGDGEDAADVSPDSSDNGGPMKYVTGQVGDPGNDGGFTDSSNDGGFTPQQTPSGNEGGFIGETVYQEEVDSSQPVNNGGNSWETSGGNYVTQKPNDYDKLTETGTTPGSGTQTTAVQGPNGLWIVDSTGLNRYPEMSIPLNGYAREEITPSVEGQITIEEMYPDGTVRTFGMGYVKPYHVYKMWFFGDVAGTHKIRYSVNGYYSNIVRFYVQGSQNQNQGASAPAASSSSTTTSSTNRIVRNGGSISHSSSSMSVSSGSMSISTSFG